jgi:hypothetical protein
MRGMSKVLNKVIEALAPWTRRRCQSHRSHGEPRRYFGLLNRNDVTDSRKGNILRRSRTLRDEIEATFVGHGGARVRICGGRRIVPGYWQGIRR